jgi:hypothetical protein
MEGPHVFHPPARNGARHSRPAFSEGVSAAIEAAFKQSWQERFHETGSEPAATENRTCSWLYFNMTMDGAGRVMPCCMAPDKSERKLVFSTFEASPALKPLSIVNSPMATLARESFASPESYRVKAGLRGHHELPYCARCQEKPSPPYGLHNVRNDLHLLDSERVIPWNLVERLTSWT